MSATRARVSKAPITGPGAISAVVRIEDTGPMTTGFVTLPASPRCVALNPLPPALM